MAGEGKKVEENITTMTSPTSMAIPETILELEVNVEQLLAVPSVTDEKAAEIASLIASLAALPHGKQALGLQSDSF